MDFKLYVKNQINLEFNKNNYIVNSTKIIFDNLNKNYESIVSYNIKYSNLNYVLNRLFLVNYYNMWIPCFPIAYENDLLYVIVLSYIPFEIKLELFNKIYNSNSNIIEKNKNTNKVIDQLGLKNIDLQGLYNTIKNLNLGFSLRPLKLSNIKKSYLISTNIMDRLVFMDPLILNLKIMKDVLLNMDNFYYKNQLSSLLEQYSKLINDYKNKSIEYTEQLKILDEYYFKIVKK